MLFKIALDGIQHVTPLGHVNSPKVFHDKYPCGR